MKYQRTSSSKAAPLADAVARDRRASRPAPSLVVLGQRENGREDKLAERISEQLIGDIAATGWAEGEVLGSEPALIERLGVSRAVFREAVRLLEHQQVARMRRGPGGGLVITSATVEAVIDPVAVYLFFARTRVDQVAEARVALEEIVAGLASSRLTEPDVVCLHELADRERAGQTRSHRELHDTLASLTKNPALELFVSLLSRLTQLYLPDASKVGRRVLLASTSAHLGILDAVIAGDQGRTRHRMRLHLEAEADYLRRRLKASQPLDASVLRSLDGRSKKGERVARAIFVEVTESGWPVGERIGSEAELMERFGVSRAVLREAVRLLEHHQIAVMRRGPGGGLFVVEPGVEVVIGALALLMERRGIRPADLLELRKAVEDTIIELAIKRLDEERAKGLQLALDAERSAEREDFALVAHDLHGVLAGSVDNPVLELVSLVLVRLTRLHLGSASEVTEPLSDAVTRAHTAIVDAVLARDVELARRRMSRHLDVLQSFVH